MVVENLGVIGVNTLPLLCLITPLKKTLNNYFIFEESDYRPGTI